MTKFQIRWYGAVIAALLLLALIAVFTPVDEGPKFDDPRFVATKYPQLSLPPKPTVGDRLRLRWENLRMRIFGRSRPDANAFLPPTPSRKSHVFGLLAQCMNFTGTKYYVEERVARGTLDFGTTTNLNPAQWEAAYKTALENQPVEWYDPQTKDMRSEPLLLVTNKQGFVIVIPTSMAGEFPRGE